MHAIFDVRILAWNLKPTNFLPAVSFRKNGLGERLRETLSCPVVQSSGPSGNGGGLYLGMGGLDTDDISLQMLLPKVNCDLFSKISLLHHRQEKCEREKMMLFWHTSKTLLSTGEAPRWKLPLLPNYRRGCKVCVFHCYWILPLIVADICTFVKMIASKLMLYQISTCDYILYCVLDSSTQFLNVTVGPKG